MLLETVQYVMGFKAMLKWVALLFTWYTCINYWQVELVIEGDDQGQVIQESNIPSTRPVCLPLRYAQV